VQDIKKPGEVDSLQWIGAAMAAFGLFLFFLL
jgi:hypothetical protein